jgi:hypothetical protein
LDFLFDNPLIIAVLIGIISSLFNKAKGQTKANPKPPKPFVENTPLPEITNFEEVREEPVRTLDTEYRDMKKEAEAKIAALKQQQKRFEQKAERMNSTTRMNQSVRSNPTATNNKATFQVDKEKLADAVIWSEILGPPRSKKPHRSLNGR